MPPYISSSDLIALQRTRATIRHMMATNSATTGSLAIAPVRQGPRHAHASPERFLCSHRPEIQCLLSELQKCCACSDQRPHSAVYDIYVDGDGYVPQGYRWSYYCSSCRGNSFLSKYSETVLRVVYA
ncbi:hypothetical protein EDC01DRAFT_394235 [Geopyxis carbonaria]|nr:hypothetical protein EDC01DRAFT_394235 [Geopyxis carbonaria]